MTIFHEKLRILYEDARDKDHKIGRTKFAEICGISKTLVDNYLNGTGWPTLDNFCKICTNLNVNPAWMVGLSKIQYNFESKYMEFADELDMAQMESVEEFARFLKYEAKQKKNKK